MSWDDVRQKIQDRFGQVNSIDKLMKDKLSPYVIMDELPLPIQIGEKVLYIGNLNLKNEDYYFKNFITLLATLGLENMIIDLMQDGMKLMQYLKMHGALRKNLTRLIIKILLKQQKWYYPKNDKTYKLNKCSYKYIENRLTKEKLIQIIFLIYTYNYDSLGKSLALILNKMGAKETSQTYMYTWLQNAAGVTGSFMIDQSQNYDWYNKEQQMSPDEAKRLLKERREKRAKKHG